MPHPNQYHQYSGQHRAHQQPIITTPSEPSARSRGHATFPTASALDTHTTPREPSARPHGYTTSPTADASATHRAHGELSAHPRSYTTFPTVGASDIRTTPGESSARSRSHTTFQTVGTSYTHTTPGELSAHPRSYTTSSAVGASDSHTTPGESSARSRSHTTFPTVGASGPHTIPSEPSARSRSHRTFPTVGASDAHTLPQAGESSVRSRGYATSPTVGASDTHTIGSITDRFRDVTISTQGFPSAPLLSGVQPGPQSHVSTSLGVTLEDLTRYITRDDEYPATHGGFGEIWKCTYKRDRRVTKVAVKSLIVYTSDRSAVREKKNKRITRELETCAQLQHKHILPIYGYACGFSPLIAIVSPWAEDGNLTTYLELSEDSGTALSLFRRFQILRDITDGLQYLHASNVVHADLNGYNVLIYADGTACLADFGLSVMLASISPTSYNSTVKGTLRWMAPELLEQREDGSPGRPSKQSDIYSFGGLMLQVLSNKIPYYYLSDLAVIRSIITPQKPLQSYYPTVSHKHWRFIDECWSTDQKKRPSIERVVDVIKDELDNSSRNTPLSRPPPQPVSQGSRGDRSANPEWR